MNRKAQELLAQYWGATEFRLGQEDAILAVLEERDGLVVLPTGGGKSLCYQLPGLLLEGVCVVISPLIALMNDQVEGLKKKGIRAMQLSGPMHEDELVTALDNCKFGDFKFLYLSPERAQNPLVQKLLSQMKISLLAIDEAHCISEWGHDFRPAYREIITLKKTLCHVPTLALTATATKKVREDICTSLELKSPARIIGSFDRPNITLNVMHTQNKLEAIAEALEPKGVPSIVYVGTRKSAELLSNHLNTMGHRSAYFHGGAPEKEKRIAEWMCEKTPVMVATTAFGMGIDKANVQRVIHTMLPFSLEQYYQEVGRCGRDGSPSVATLFVEKDDEKKLWNRLTASVPPKEAIQKTYKHLCHYFNVAYGELPQFILGFNLNLFCQRYRLSPKMTFYVLELLERGQVLSLTQYDSPKTALRLEPNQKRESVLTDYLLRNVGGITAQIQSIQLAHIAIKCGVSLQDCLVELKTLEKNGQAEIPQLHVDSGIQFLTPREDKHTLLPILQKLGTLKNEKKRLADTVWDYCTTTSCYRKKLLDYFDDSPKKTCQSCSNCVHKNSSTKNVILQLKNLLSRKETVSLEQLISESTYSSTQLIKALEIMVNEELIEQLNTNTYRLL